MPDDLFDLAMLALVAAAGLGVFQLLRVMT
jgi:hypothetical protein